VQVPILETPRLILRPIVQEDVPAVQKYFGCWEIIQYIGATVPWPYPPDGAQHWFDNIIGPEIKKGTTWVWGLVLKAEPFEVIGVIHLRSEPPSGQSDAWAQDMESHRGFWLGVPFQGQGLMTEAVAAVNDWVFGTLGWEKMIVKNAAGNEASRRVKVKTGAHFLRMEPGKYLSGITESEVWEVRREDWLAVREKEKQA
jgi:ribosomal-protein-alanine N-acetyltransferase